MILQYLNMFFYVELTYFYLHPIHRLEGEIERDNLTVMNRREKYVYVAGLFSFGVMCQYKYFVRAIISTLNVHMWLFSHEH